MSNRKYSEEFKEQAVDQLIRSGKSVNALTLEIVTYIGTGQELIYGRRFTPRAQAKAEIFHYIEVFYNRQRLHSILGYVFGL